MYIHPPHQFTDPEALFSLVTAHPLGAWVHPGRDGLLANPGHSDGRGGVHRPAALRAMTLGSAVAVSPWRRHRS